MMFFVLFALCVLVSDTGAAKSYGSSNSGYGSSNSGLFSNKNSNKGINSNSQSYYGPVRSYGAGYWAHNKSVSGGQYGYPNGGYGFTFLNGYFLHSGDHNDYDVFHGYDEYDTYFDRVENGCQLIGVDSYRTIDNHNDIIAPVDDWVGCSEEWKYTVGVSYDSNTTFVSPPLERYACDKFDSCAECENELRGKNFDAMTLEPFEYPNSTYFVDCYIPINLTFVNENFECNNEECIFLSEKYEYSAATTNMLLHWAIVSMSGCIAMAMLW